MDNNQRLERFRQAVLENSREKAEQLIAEAKAEVQESSTGLIDAENARFARQCAQVQKEYAQTAARESAQLELDAKKKVLSYRKTLVDGLFEDVRAEIAAFVKNDKYKGYVLSKLKAAKEKYPEGFECSIRQEDSALANDIKSQLGIDVKVSSAIKMGGVYIMPNGASVMLDETLDTAFEEQREAFSQSHRELEILNEQ